MARVARAGVAHAKVVGTLSQSDYTRVVCKGCAQGVCTQGVCAGVVGLIILKKSGTNFSNSRDP